MAEYPENCGSGEDMKVDGKVGIGTTSPTGQLNVVKGTGDLQIGDSNNAHLMNWISSAASGANDPVRINARRSRSGGAVADNDNLLWLLAYGHDGTNYDTGGGGIQLIVDGAVSSNRVPTEMHFLTAQGAADDDWGTKMIIKPNGNVGIGMTTPSYLLDVNGATGLRITDPGTSNQAGLRIYSTHANAGSRNWWIGISQAAYGDFGILQSNAKDGDPRVSGSSRFYIDPNGNVGIGTTSPQSKLDINGGVAIGSYAGVNAAPSNGLIVSGNVGAGLNNPGANDRLTIKSAGADSNYFGLKVQDSNGNNQLVVRSDGTVGIGTITPGSKLDVQGGIRLGAAGANNILNTSVAAGGASGDLFWGNLRLIDQSNKETYTVTPGNVTSHAVTLINAGYGLSCPGSTGEVNLDLDLDGTSLVKSVDGLKIKLDNPNTWAGQTFSGNTNFPYDGVWGSDGNLKLGYLNALYVGLYQVVGPRESAISNANTVHSVNSWATTNAALDALGTTINDILDALRAHGLIAT